MSENRRDANLNIVILSGRMTRDPELKYLPSGMAITTFGLAWEHRREKDGAWESETEFFEIITWDKLAERVGDKLYKGCPVTIEGRLTQDRWEKDGKQHSRVKVTGFKVHPGEWQRSSDTAAKMRAFLQELLVDKDARVSPGVKAEIAALIGGTAPETVTEGDDDDIPF